MPTYAYACTSCGHEFEVVQSISDPTVTTCESCSGPVRKVFHPVGVAFKGSGFYRTDSRAGGGSTSSANTGDGSGKTSDKKGSDSSGSSSSSSSGSKSDSSSSAKPAGSGTSSPAGGSSTSKSGGSSS